MGDALEPLLARAAPAIRDIARIQLHDEDPASPALVRVQREIKTCERVRLLLSGRGAAGQVQGHPYHQKWTGAHWVLADLDYPVGDPDLQPLCEQVYRWLFSAGHRRTIERFTIAGCTRMCASMAGNAIYSLLKLGLADERVDQLVERLLAWQWPDGDWNCDKHPEARVSSFTETLLPLRGLALYSRVAGHREACAATERAAEVFLQRRLFRRLSDGTVIAPDFLKLRYPWYWHYDILFGLKVLAEAGFLHDGRAREAVELLAAKRLPDGGFPAQTRHYISPGHTGSGRSLADWGGTRARLMNRCNRT